MKLEGNFSGSAMELKKCSQWISWMSEQGRGAEQGHLEAL
jgi:hypothetical protein